MNLHTYGVELGVLREQGSDAYRKGDYAAAIDIYSRALQFEGVAASDKALLCTNRAAAFLMIQRQSDAAADCDSAVQFAGSDTVLVVKALVRKSTAQKQMGRLQAAIDTLNFALGFDTGNVSIQKDLSTLKSSKSKLESLPSIVNSAVRLSTAESVTSSLGCSFRDINLIKARALIELQRTEEAYNISNVMMRQSGSGDVELLHLRAQILYARGDLENSLKHLQQAARADPDNSDVRTMLRRVRDMEDCKRSGDSFFREGRYEEAIGRWTACIQADPANVAVMAKVYYNRATALHKLRRNEEAVEDCSRAIEGDREYLKAYAKRADCNHSLGTPERIQKAIRCVSRLA